MDISPDADSDTDRGTLSGNSVSRLKDIATLSQKSFDSSFLAVVMAVVKPPKK